MYSIRSTLAGHKRSSNGQEKVQSDLVPILFARIRTRLGKPKPQTIRILLDSGASASIFNIKYLNKLRLKRKLLRGLLPQAISRHQERQKYSSLCQNYTMTESSNGKYT
jgi:hypothetical protein